MDDFLKFVQNYQNDMESNAVPQPEEVLTDAPMQNPPAPPEGPAIDPRLEAAMGERDRRDKMAMLLNATRQLGQAGVTSTGSNVQLDNSAAEMMSKSAQNPMSDAKDQINMERQGKQDEQAKEKHDMIMDQYTQKLQEGDLDITNKQNVMDPGSNESAFAQSFAMDINPKLNKETVSQMSAAELYKYIPQMQSLAVAHLRAKNEGSNRDLMERRVAASEDRNALMREKEAGVGGRFEQSHDLRLDKFGNQKKEKDQDQSSSIVKGFEGDKVVQKSNEMSAGSDTALSLLNSDNPIGHKAVVNFMARATGEVGALTEEDKRPFGGSQALDSRLAQATKEYKDGTLTEENKQFLQGLATTMKRSAGRNKAIRAMDLVSRNAKAYGMEKKDVMELMMPGLAKFEGVDREAVEWALMNPTKPQSDKILRKHGM